MVLVWKAIWTVSFRRLKQERQSPSRFRMDGRSNHLESFSARWLAQWLPRREAVRRVRVGWLAVSGLAVRGGGGSPSPSSRDRRVVQLRTSHGSEDARPPARRPVHPLSSDCVSHPAGRRGRDGRSHLRRRGRRVLRGRDGARPIDFDARRRTVIRCVVCITPSMVGDAPRRAVGVSSAHAWDEQSTRKAAAMIGSASGQFRPGRSLPRDPSRRARCARVAAVAVLASGLLLVPNLGTPADGAANPERTSAQAAHNNPFAVVAADGTWVRGTSGTTVTHSQTGLYEVHLTRRVTGCAANANLGYPGDHEEYYLPTAVTVGHAGDRHAINIDVSWPSAEGPVLVDNAFHLRLQCGPAGEHAVVQSDGTVRSPSSGVSAVRDSTGVYTVTLPASASGCAPVATVGNNRARTARAIQAYLTLGNPTNTITVDTIATGPKPTDAPFRADRDVHGSLRRVRTEPGLLQRLLRA